MGLNDSLAGFEEVGVEIGGFLEGIAPGIFYIVVVLAVAAGIGLLLKGLFLRIKGGI
jgi:hypothetical protein